jgi:hypothetical protein
MPHRRTNFLLFERASQVNYCPEMGPGLEAGRSAVPPARGKGCRARACELSRRLPAGRQVSPAFFLQVIAHQSRRRDAGATRRGKTAGRRPALREAKAAAGRDEPPRGKDAGETPTLREAAKPPAGGRRYEKQRPTVRRALTVATGSRVNTPGGGYGGSARHRGGVVGQSRRQNFGGLVCKPDSVERVFRVPVESTGTHTTRLDDHSSRSGIAPGLERPTRE